VVNPGLLLGYPPSPDRPGDRRASCEAIAPMLFQILAALYARRSWGGGPPGAVSA